MTSDEFAERIEAMMGALYRMCCTLVPNAQDREDAVQECLLKAYSKLGSLREERYFQTWVMRILINECHAITSKYKRIAPVANVPESAAPGSPSSLQGTLRRLPERERLPIVLHYIQGYSTADVARILKLTQGTVKSRMRRARELLRDYLSEEGITP